MFATRTEQTTTTTGTGTLDLIPAVTGRENFIDTIGNGVASYYTVQMADESQWEEGIGSVVAGSPNQLTRAQVIKSTNANALVNFPSGTKTVFIGIAADALRFGSAGSVPTESGAAGARTVSYAPAIRSLRAGMQFTFLSNYAGSGGAQTLNINGTGAYALKTGDGLSNPDLYDLPSGGVLVKVVFDGSKFLLATAGRMAQRSLVSGILSSRVGQIILVPGTTAPAGTLKANGPLISRTTYADLWTYAQGSGNLVTEATWLSGNNYAHFSSGDLSTNFRIPELRGEFPRFWDDGRGVDSGRSIGVRQDQAYLNHNHGTTESAHNHTSGDGPINSNLRYGVVNTGVGGNQNQQSGTTTTGGYTSSTSTGLTVNTSTTGGSETRPVNVPLLACIYY